MIDKPPDAEPPAGAKAIAKILLDRDIAPAAAIATNVVTIGGKPKASPKSKKLLAKDSRGGGGVDVDNLVIADFEKKPARSSSASASKPSKDGAAGGSGGGAKRPPRGRGGPPSDPEDDRVSIKRSAHNLDKEIKTATAALAADPPEIFRFGDRIVRPQIIELLTAKEKTYSPALKDAGDFTVLEALARRTKWFRFDRRSQDWLGIAPPKEIAAQIVSAGGWANLPAICGIVGAPCLRPDGSVLSRLGYDAQSQIFYLANSALEIGQIADKPSRAEADEALEDLGFLISGFPFVSDVDRSAALSLLLTPALRSAFDVVPMHAIKAPVAGSGKSLLCDLASGIAFGEKVGVIAASRDPVEVEKAITGAMLLSVPLVALDNWNFVLDSNFVAQAIERSVMRLRQLGSSSTFRTINCTSFMVNGNGLTIGGDVIRRTIMCNLDPRCENAEFREFEFNPFDEILIRRAKYVRACLVIGKFGLAAPPHGKPELASFEMWDRCIRRGLIALGCADPCGSIEKTRMEAPDVRAHAFAVSCLSNVFGNTSFTSRGAMSAATEHAKDSIFPTAPTGMTEAMQADLREALLGVAEANGIISAKRLGKWLTRNKDRIINGLKIEEVIGDLSMKVLRFQIARM